MRKISTSSCAVLLAMTASMIGCVPASFNGLTEDDPTPAGSSGATPAAATPPQKDPRNASPNAVSDSSVLAPRPLAPLSVSYINSLQPKLRWAAAPGNTGAIIEIARTRAELAVGGVVDPKTGGQTITATGTDYTFDKPLAPGFWFWHVKGYADGTTPKFGTTASATWELFVRTPGPNAKPSTAANGGILDIDGDGVPDIAMTYVAKPENVGDPNERAGITFSARPDGEFSLDEDSIVGFNAFNLDLRLEGGIDLDGDGYADLISSELTSFDESSADGSPTGDGNDYASVFLWHGGVNGANDGADDTQPEIWIPLSHSIPTISAFGDLNGDGYGDVAVQGNGLGVVGLGSPIGNTSIMIYSNDEDVTATLPVASGIDFDGDGLSDVVAASTVATSPIRYTRGEPDRLKSLSTLTLASTTIPTRAGAIASGDFDGNGTMDIAFSTVFGSQAAVCIYTPNAGPLSQDKCWLSGTPDQIATSIVAGDLNNDGIDDLVIAGTSGITMLILTTQPAATSTDLPQIVFTAQPVQGSFGQRVTMLHPGRGGTTTTQSFENARWAALGADGMTFYVFEGTKPSQTISIVSHKFLLQLGPAIR